MNNISRRQFLTKTLKYSAITLLASYPTFIERKTVLTNRYRIAVPNLPEAFSGFRIAHLTDIHHRWLTSLAFIRGVVERTNSLKPDLIACTGDYVYRRSSSAAIDGVWRELSRLSAPHGAWSVLGNHDTEAGKTRAVQWLEKNGQNLHHRAVRIERNGQALWLAGAGDFLTDHSDLDPLLAQIPEQECRILLAHNPDSADTVFRKRIDLILAGHTHGGQVQLPIIGQPFLPVLNKKYVSGLTTSVRGVPLFISRGIGWTILPIRFNCYPEIAILELYKT